MKKQTIETATERRYESPFCEEIPVLAEGPLCSSGDDSDKGGNESYTEYDGTL